MSDDASRNGKPAERASAGVGSYDRSLADVLRAMDADAAALEATEVALRTATAADRAAL